MQKVCIFDRNQMLKKYWSDYAFLSDGDDVMLQLVPENVTDMVSFVVREAPDILLIVSDVVEEKMLKQLSQVKVRLAMTQILLVASEAHYDIIRRIFLCGVYDYILMDKVELLLKASLLQCMRRRREEQICESLQEPMDCLVKAILMGADGEELKGDIEAIINQLYEEYREPIMVQSMLAVVKRKLYIMITMSRGWLEKFLYEPDYKNEVSIAGNSRKELIDEWCHCFGYIGFLVQKYKMKNDRLICRIESYVIEHVDDKLSLQKVAQGVYLNASYVSSVFKKGTGMNFTDFVAEVKVDRAKVLLREENIKIYDVAANIGYQNVEYFTKIFKRKTGMAPMEYKKRWQC